MRRTTQRRPRARKHPAAIDWLAPRAPRRIRSGRVLSAQARIAAGHYDRPDVRETLVEKLLEALNK